MTNPVTHEEALAWVAEQKAQGHTFVDDHGARGWPHDDTSAFVDAALDNDGTVYMPPGRFKVKMPIDEARSWIGAGPNQTRIG